MQTYYLYVKTHKKSHLKYLGYTGREDPYLYPGSGIDWVAHLEEFGYDYDTEILFTTYSKEEIKTQGLHYSILWNIVESPEWANRKLEEGDGGATTTGTIGWNNGNQNRYSVESPGPEWIQGLLKQTSKWWNNGSIETKTEKIPGPEWTAGRLVGKKTWNNGTVECRSFNSPGSEWKLGRINTESRNKSKKALAGLWWNNGTENKKSHECPGTEWQSGMLKTGKLLWNNGSIRKRSKTAPGPDWVLGDIPNYRGGCRWWNNGVKSIMRKESPGTEWVPGRIFK